MKGSMTPKKNPVAKKSLAGAAKGGGMSGGSMKGGSMSVPKAPGSNKPARAC